jgi:phage terminase small subunit
MLKAIDASILEVWAVAYCYYRRAVAAQELLDSAEGATALLVTTPNGHQQQSPYIPIINRQAEILSKAAEKLGFSPTARPRIGLTLGGGELNGSTHAPATGEESIDDYLARTPRSKAVH